MRLGLRIVVPGAVALSVLAMSGMATVALVREQAAENRTSNVRKIQTIVADLADYALKAGNWDDVEAEGLRLSGITGKRIKLTTESAGHVLDTDLLTRRNSRPADKPVARIDPRPQLTFVEGQDGQAYAITLVEIREFRESATRAACLVEAGIPVVATWDANSVPRFAPAPGAGEPSVRSVQSRCPTGTLTADNFLADKAALTTCARRYDTPPPVWKECLAQAFRTRIDAVTADPVLLQVGTVRDGAALIFTPPLALAVALVALSLIALVISIGYAVGKLRRMVTPVVEHREEPASGGDLAALNRSYDQMADALRQEEYRQRQMVADVAHELRTPLSNMRAYLEGLSEGIILPEPRLFASMHEEALLQQRIIDDLRRRAIAGDGPTEPEWAELDLAELAETGALAHLPSAEGVGLRLNVVTDGPMPVVGDAGRLRQVIGNMLSNAVRYTPPGGAVQVRTWWDGDLACLSVSDTGVGISEHDVPRVFDRLWRADTARGRTSDGTGLGMFIARQIVAEHGGVMWVDSRLGVGSTFTVSLPRAGMPAVDPLPGEVRHGPWQPQAHR